MSKPRQRVRRARLLGTATIASVAALALAACGSGSTTTASGEGGSISDAAVSQAKATIAKLEQPITAWPSVAPVDKQTDLHGKTVMVIPLGDTIPVMHGMALGAKQALEHLGATITLCDGKINPTQIASCLQQAASQHVFGVISEFVSYPMDANAFDATAKAGVKVLIAGDTPEQGKTYATGIGFFPFAQSLQTLSEHEADAAIAEKGKDANVIWLGQTDSADTIAQAAAGEKRFKQLCPSCGFQLAHYSTANQDKIPSTVSSLLVRNPKTNVVVLPVDTLAPQAIQGIQSAGFTQKVTIISTGSDLSGLQRIASGSGQSHDFAAPVLYNGYSMVDGLLQLAGGQQVTPLTNVTRDITKRNVKDLELTEDEYFTNHWFGDDSFEQAFYDAWGAK